MTLEEGSAGGGSDGNFTAALGVPTLDGFGAIGDGAHALHEHVEIDALVPRAATIAGLLDASGPRRLALRTPSSCDADPVTRAHQRHHFLDALVVVLRRRTCWRRAARTSSTISGYSRLSIAMK